MKDIDKIVLEIVSNKSYNVRKAWMDDRILQSKQKQNFDVSSCIDRLNAIAKGSSNNKTIDALSLDLTN